MEISNIIVVLLFIIPGIIARRVYYLFDYPSETEKSDFMKMVSGVLNSLPIIFICSLIFACILKVKSLIEFMGYFDNLIFIATFVLFTAILSIAYGYILARTRRMRLNIINNQRKKLDKMQLNEGTLWRDFILEKNKARYLEIQMNGQTYKGFAGGFSTPDENMALILELDTWFDEYENFNPEELFKKVTRTYFDIERNVVIKDCDMSEYNKWDLKKEKKTEVNPLASAEEG